MEVVDMENRSREEEQGEQVTVGKGEKISALVQKTPGCWLYTNLSWFALADGTSVIAVAPTRKIMNECYNSIFLEEPDAFLNILKVGGSFGPSASRITTCKKNFLYDYSF